MFTVEQRMDRDLRNKIRHLYTLHQEGAAAEGKDREHLFFPSARPLAFMKLVVPCFDHHKVHLNDGKERLKGEV